MRRTRDKLERRWAPGIFLGVRESTTEKIVGTKDGVYVVQSVHRVADGDRFDADALKAVRGFPWKPTPEEDEGAELPEPMSIAPEVPEHPAMPAAVAHPAPHLKQHYILKSELEKFGYTPGCQACMDTRAGRARRGGVVHTPACRARIEEASAQDPTVRERLEGSRERLVEQAAAEPGKRASDGTQAPEDTKRVRFEGDEPPNTGGASSSGIVRLPGPKRPGGDDPGPASPQEQLWGPEDDPVSRTEWVEVDHERPRKMLAIPTHLKQCKDRDPSLWTGRRVTQGVTCDGQPIFMEDNWLSMQDPQRMLPDRWVGWTKFEARVPVAASAAATQPASASSGGGASGAVDAAARAVGTEPEGARSSTKRPLDSGPQGPEDVGANDADRQIQALVRNTREEYFEYVQSLGEDRPVCEESVPDLEWHDEAGFGYYVDDVSGRDLDAGLVEEARRAEIDIISQMQVWEVVDRPAGKTVIGTRWVDVNKGDEDHPNYRSRLVAKEIRRGSLQEYFAAMPPLAALRLLVAFAVSAWLPDSSGKRKFPRERYVLSFVDVKRAHFCSEATREVYVELPWEAGAPEGKVGRLLRSMYGCRDAGMNWELTVAKAMKQAGFTQGTGSPCVYFHRERELRVVVHGDDFTTLGPRVSLDWFHETLKAA